MKNRKSIVCLDPGHDSQWANPSPVVPAYFEGQRMWDPAQLLASRLEDRGPADMAEASGIGIRGAEKWM